MKITTILNFLDNFLKTKKSERNLFEIIWWWESRRLLFNIFTALLILLNLITIFFRQTTEFKDGAGYTFLMPLYYMLFFNILYTFLFAIEVLLDTHQFDNKLLFKFFLTITCTPWLIIILIRSITFSII